jgi:hypothetical protein
MPRKPNPEKNVTKNTNNSRAQAPDERIFKFSNSRYLQIDVVQQIYDAIGKADLNNSKLDSIAFKAAIEFIQNYKPQDDVEVLLLSQIAVTQKQFMKFMQLANHPDQTEYGKEFNLRYAAKFSSLFIKQIATLGKYRRRGQQHIFINNNVNFQEGGQAIVGAVGMAAGMSGDKQSRPKSPHKPNAEPVKTGSGTPTQDPGALRYAPGEILPEVEISGKRQKVPAALKARKRSKKTGET